MVFLQTGSAYKLENQMMPLVLFYSSSSTSSNKNYNTVTSMTYRVGMCLVLPAHSHTQLFQGHNVKVSCIKFYPYHMAELILVLRLLLILSYNFVCVVSFSGHVSVLRKHAMHNLMNNSYFHTYSNRELNRVYQW